MQKTLLHNQSLLDFTLHHCGTLNGIVQMAVENNIGITDLLSPGAVFSVPSNITKDNDIVEFYSNKKLVPACGYNTLENQNNSDFVFAYEFAISL